jgi:uncharacterized protein YndB with AHSA1/START domain
MPTSDKFAVDKPKLQVRISRIFNATRQHVWDVVNDPQLIAEWWGPARYETRVDIMDVRVGGKWRFVHSGRDGEFAFNGTYKEIDLPRKVVMTFEFEPMAGHVNTQTMLLEELSGGKTRMDVTVQFNNLPDLEGMVESGMKEGNLESYDRLDLVLAVGTN